MSHEKALSSWHSIRTTFILFLLVVPIVMFARANDGSAEASSLEDMIGPGAGLIGIAGLLAETCRRAINYAVGEAVCRWGPAT